MSLVSSSRLFLYKYCGADSIRALVNDGSLWRRSRVPGAADGRGLEGWGGWIRVGTGEREVFIMINDDGSLWSRPCAVNTPKCLCKPSGSNTAWPHRSRKVRLLCKMDFWANYSSLIKNVAELAMPVMWSALLTLATVSFLTASSSLHPPPLFCICKIYRNIGLYHFKMRHSEWNYQYFMQCFTNFLPLHHRFNPPFMRLISCAPPDLVWI